MSKRLVLVVPLLMANALAVASSAAPEAGAANIQLKTISARTTGKGASLVIEATEPAAYIATRPDPLTIYVDFRNVGTVGVANKVSNDDKSPIAGVAVETGDSLGAPVSRVRVTLAEPVGYRVRSERNTVVVDFEKRTGLPFVLPPVSRTRPDAMSAIDRPETQRPDAMSAINAAIAGARGVAPSPRPQAAAVLAAVPQGAGAPGPTPLNPQAPTPPPTGPAGQIGVASPNERRFTGNPVSLDFQGADLRAVLRTFSEISGLNIVIDPAVTGSVDVALREVPWDQALDIILRANKLGYIIDGTIVRIAPLAVLADEETQRRKLADEQALAGELRVLTRTVSYAKAEELVNLLTKSALSPRGTVQVDPRTNTLIITDLANRLQTAADLIGTLDKAQPQVEIEGRIVQTNKNFARQLGIQWGFGGRVDPALGNTTNLAFPNSGTLTGRAAAAQGQTLPAGTAVNFPAAAAPSAVGLALGSINGAFNLDVALSALESSGNARILSTPRVSTQNNVEAEVAQGTQIPIQTVANNTVTVSFRDAVLTLRVTPQITDVGTVIMKIVLENATPDFSRSVNGIPPINTQRANTTVLVSDGQTTVIGGIFLSNEQTQQDRTPGLSQVPLLKWLFKRDRLDDTSSELLIFVTPRIIKG